MKLAYIVTRIMYKTEPGIIAIPNLGVFSGLERAWKHFEAVVKDRAGTKDLHELKNGIRLNTESVTGRYEVVASFLTPDGSEEIRLEKWMMLPNETQYKSRSYR